MYKYLTERIVGFSEDFPSEKNNYNEMIIWIWIICGSEEWNFDENLLYKLQHLYMYIYSNLYIINK